MTFEEFTVFCKGGICSPGAEHVEFYRKIWDGGYAAGKKDACEAVLNFYRTHGRLPCGAEAIAAIRALAGKAVIGGAADDV
jgi:hypothetical protein